MNLKKYKRTSVAALLRHDSRIDVENRKNEKIDSTRSHLNYNLVSGDDLDNYNKRMSEVFCINRKDINTLASIVITAPKNLNKIDEERFFIESLKYYKNIFGEKNIVSAWVHLDETTPHIHIKFIPVYAQTKTLTRGKDKGKVITRDAVSFDEVCPRIFYKNNHQFFQKYIDEKLGYHVDILNGSTKGVPTIEALKELSDINKEINIKNSELDSVRNIQLKKPKCIPEPTKNFLGNYNPDQVEKLHEYAQNVSNDIIDRDNSIEILKCDLNNAHKIIDDLQNADLYARCSELSKVIDNQQAHIKKLDNELKNADSKISNLENENKELKSWINEYNALYNCLINYLSKVIVKVRNHILNFFDNNGFNYLRKDVNEHISKSQINNQDDFDGASNDYSNNIFSK